MFPRAELYKVLESGGQKQQIPHPKNNFEYTAVMLIKRCLTKNLHFTLINFLRTLSFFSLFFDISKYWNIPLRVML